MATRPDPHGELIVIPQTHSWISRSRNATGEDRKGAKGGSESCPYHQFLDLPLSKINTAIINFYYWITAISVSNFLDANSLAEYTVTVSIHKV